MASQASFDFLTSPAAAPAPSLKFAFRSGMSRSKDFWAAAGAGAAIGVVASELSMPLRFIGIPRFLAEGGALFIDSGAFAELATGEAPDFDKVLGVYESIADNAGHRFNGVQLYVVAPDKVGDQGATLERLATYAKRVRALIDLGCKVIVPLQRGALSAVEMLDCTAAILRTREFVAGIPSNKEALSIAECASLKHHAYHVLGRVQMNQDQLERLAALAQGNPDAEITADANWLRSRLGLVTELGERERQARVAASNGSLLPYLIETPRAAAIKAAMRADTTWGQAA